MNHILLGVSVDFGLWTLIRFRGKIMLVQIVSTTDKRNVGRILEIETIDYTTCSHFGIHPERITWFGDMCIIQNVNYTIKLKRVGD